MPGNYVHQTVNHSRNFVNPVTGAHTNNVESYWMRAKAVFKRMSGTSKDMVPGYLDEFMWRERFGRNFNLAYINILHHIAECYLCYTVDENGPFQGKQMKPAIFSAIK